MNNVSCDNYHSLTDWKRSNFGVVRAEQWAYYNCEIKRTGLIKLGKVIEVGFGNGSFLEYCKQSGVDCIGVEKDKHQVKLANSAGYNAIHDENIISLMDDSFDLVVAFDVIEHLEKEDIIKIIEVYKNKLKKNGLIIARSPNGDSPFSMMYQNGDLTHTTIIGSGKIHQIAKLVDMDVVFMGKECMPIFCNNFLVGMYRMLVSPIRLVFNYIIKAIFFPKSNADFMSPNLVFILKK
jgi:cyclopropane fatty-acyl-phospholipid synthase-like methyltransferase